MMRRKQRCKHSGLFYLTMIEAKNPSNVIYDTIHVHVYVYSPKTTIYTMCYNKTIIRRTSQKLLQPPQQGILNSEIYNSYNNEYKHPDIVSSCYIKCAKMFLGFTKYYSVTSMLLLTGLPSFDTLMINARKSDAARWNVNSNVLVKSLLVV